jgi:hypothetical protein
VVLSKIYDLIVICEQKYEDKIITARESIENTKLLILKFKPKKVAHRFESINNSCYEQDEITKNPNFKTLEYLNYMMDKKALIKLDFR